MDYDPLLAKLIGFGTDREQAIMRLERALYEYFVAGIKTNISLFRRILRDADFRAGKLDTGYLDRLLARPIRGADGRAPEPRIAAIAAGMFAVLDPPPRGRKMGMPWRLRPTVFKLERERTRGSTALKLYGLRSDGERQTTPAGIGESRTPGGNAGWTAKRFMWMRCCRGAMCCRCWSMGTRMK